MRVVTASDDLTARDWDAQPSQPVTSCLQHREKVVTAQFSPDGSWVVTASLDNTARVWDARSGKLPEQLTGFGRALRRAVVVGAFRRCPCDVDGEMSGG